MKVWYVLMIFPGASETFVANDIRALVELGVDVSAHALRAGRADAARLLRERDLSRLPVSFGDPRNVLRGLVAAAARPLVTVDLIAWIVRHCWRQPVHLVKSVALVPRLMELFGRLERNPPDVVHLYWGHYPAIFGWLVLRRAPHVVVSISLSAYDLLRGFPGSAVVARKAHVVSTWAGANVEPIAALGVPAHSVDVIWQGVDLRKIEGRRFDKVARRIVTAGRLLPEKGMDDVLRAFAEILGTFPDARLAVLGEGPDRARLEELTRTLKIASAVEFRGHVSHEHVFDELERAQVFLFLSRYRGERLPNVVKEAMASRCAVVTTGTPGIEELLEDGVHGCLVPEGDWKQAARRVIELFDDANRTRALTQAAQQQVFENFELRTLMTKMIARWEHVRADPASFSSRDDVRFPNQTAGRHPLVQPPQERAKPTP